MTGLHRLPLFSYGFRPFFLAAGLTGLLAVPAWLWLYHSGVSPLGPVSGQLWHGHEMIFGFIVAAVAGFLLTAVPSWTGSRGFGGAPLVALTAIWLAGRAAFAAFDQLPLVLVAIVELAFLPGILVLVAPPTLRERNRNMPMLAIVAVAWLADATSLVAIARGDAALGSLALHAALNVILLLLTIVGGRIVPAFTSNALRRGDQSFSIHTYPWLERILPGAMVLNLLVDLWQPALTVPAGLLAAVLAVLQGWRLSGWRSLRARGEPMLWVLHIAYAWLPAGFALKAAALLAGADWARFWLHAFGSGAAALMILAVMTRTTLGHTGRPLVVPRSIAVAYLLLCAAALLRVVAPSIWAAEYSGVLLAAGLCWSAAFAIFVAVYAPMLTRPRVDGKTG
jgi:uncharacterized protein involved in response to NO